MPTSSRCCSPFRRDVRFLPTPTRRKRGGIQNAAEEAFSEDKLSTAFASLLGGAPGMKREGVTQQKEMHESRLSPDQMEKAARLVQLAGLSASRYAAQAGNR